MLDNICHISDNTNRFITENQIWRDNGREKGIPLAGAIAEDSAKNQRDGFTWEKLFSSVV